MKTTIDAAGRLVIPKENRRQAGFQPGTPLEVRWQDGRIEIEPAPRPVRLERRGSCLVAVPAAGTDKLHGYPSSAPGTSTMNARYERWTGG